MRTIILLHKAARDQLEKGNWNQIALFNTAYNGIAKVSQKIYNQYSEK